MLFEYDEHKNELNIEKHKVSFEEAQEIWDDPDLVVFPARKRGESANSLLVRRIQRYLVWCTQYGERRFA